MTLFGLFRVLSGEYKLKLSTITDDFTGDSVELQTMSTKITFYSQNLLNGFVGSMNQMRISDLFKVSLRTFTSSSPSSKVSFFGLLYDAFALSQHPIIRYSLARYLEVTQQSLFLKYFLLFTSEKF
jgi:hypothetical protein